MYDKTNRYRKPVKRLAYEVALIVAGVMTCHQLNGMTDDVAIPRTVELPSVFSRVFEISFDDAREVLNKAYRVERGRRIEKE